MNTVKIEKDNVKMVAHRGVSGIETENTLSAFVAAGNRSYFGIECDVHVTADKQFIIVHDSSLLRVAGVDMIVEETAYDTLRKVILKNRNGAESIDNYLPDRGDLILPSLAEYIGVCKKYQKKAVLELKERFETQDIVRLIAAIEEQAYLENVIFISFNFENMKDLRELLPKQKLQFLSGEIDDTILEKLDAYDLDFDVKYTSLTKEWIEKLHNAGHKVNCWTCDQKEDAERLVSWGVDFITTNILE